MAYRRFELAVVAQVALILAVCIAAAYLMIATRYYASVTLVLIVLGLQVVWLLHYLHKTNRDLGRFLTTIRYSDFSQSFSAGADATQFGKLAAAFEGVLQRFRETRTAKEEQSSYLNTLVQHVPIAVIAVEESGRIDLFNHAARRLLGVSDLRNLGDYSGFGPEFYAEVMGLEAGPPALMKVLRDNELLQLSVAVTMLRMRGRQLRIVTLQDIRRELEARELTAWQNLIRVLTHEIMNSVTPITSLATTAGELLEDAGRHGAGRAAIGDAKDAVDTIAQRGAGLLHFVDSYRRLTHLPKPAVQEFRVGDVFERIRQLMGRELEEKSIALVLDVAGDGVLSADSELIEQAIINLVRNAIDAVDGVENARVRLSAQVDAGDRPYIAVTDNGAGINDEVRENMFVPFYTTKRHGTGVGLSVVQQIMRSHDGSVEVMSTSGQGTTIRLVF